MFGTPACSVQYVYYVVQSLARLLDYIDANRASWIVLYTQATSSQAFAHTVREGRERIIDLVARMLLTGTRNPEPDTDFHMMAIALVGAGEAVATRVSAGDVDVDDAVELFIKLFWRGLKGKPSERDAVDGADTPDAAALRLRTPCVYSARTSPVRYG